MNLRGTLSAVFSLNAAIWLTMLLALAALLSLAAAAWLAMAPLVGMALAALFTGLGLLAVALLFALWLSRSGRHEKEARNDTGAAAPSHSEITIEESLRPLIGDRALDWTRQNAGLVTLGAFATGLVIAASPTARRALTRVAAPAALQVWRSFRQPED